MYVPGRAKIGDTVMSRRGAWVYLDFLEVQYLYDVGYGDWVPTVFWDIQLDMCLHSND